MPPMPGARRRGSLRQRRPVNRPGVSTRLSPKAAGDRRGGAPRADADPNQGCCRAGAARLRDGVSLAARVRAARRRSRARSRGVARRQRAPSARAAALATSQAGVAGDFVTHPTLRQTRWEDDPPARGSSGRGAAHADAGGRSPRPRSPRAGVRAAAALGGAEAVSPRGRRRGRGSAGAPHGEHRDDHISRRGISARVALHPRRPLVRTDESPTRQPPRRRGGRCV